MGRKKKNNLEQPIEQTSSTTTSINYKGSLKVQMLTKNGSVISTKKYHNEGYISMFQCLGFALIGQYNRSLCPRYVMAFDQPQEDPEWIEANSKSTMVPYVNTPALINGTNAVSIVYTFYIPKNAFSPEANINTFALYSESNRTNLQSPSASFKLDPSLSVSDMGTTVFIEWTIEIGNIQK